MAMVERSAVPIITVSFDIQLTNQLTKLRFHVASRREGDPDPCFMIAGTQMQALLILLGLSIYVLWHHGFPQSGLVGCFSCTAKAACETCASEFTTNTAVEWPRRCTIKT